MKIKTIKNLISIALMLCVVMFYPASGLSKAKETVTSAAGPSYQPELKIHQVEVPVTPRSNIETLYSWSLRNADVRDVMLTFAKGSKINIVVEPGVSGQVTVDLTKVKFEEALDYILHPLELEYAKEGNFVRVFKPKLETKIFSLNYVNTQRTGSGTLSASSGGSSGSLTSNTSMDFWGAAVNGLSTIIFGTGGGGGIGTGGSFSKEDSEGRKLLVNAQSGIVMVTALQETLEEVDSFIKALEASSQRQVLIQAKIVEVTLSDDFELGINWSNIGKFPIPTILGDKGILSIGTGGAFNTGLIPSPSAETFQMGVSNEKLNVLLDAMATQGNLNVLSSPQIVTLNNQTAMIKVTREDVYFEITTTIDDDTSARTEKIKGKTMDVGIVLDVTPQISGDGLITLNIHPSISEIVDTATSKLGDTMPIVDRRETNTVVKVRDGQTIVMAGLIKDKQTENLRMVPCLGEIPILGALFRHTVQTTEKVELVIMLTPLILTKDRVDLVNKYKSGEMNKIKKNFHLGVHPLSEGLKGEFEIK